MPILVITLINYQISFSQTDSWTQVINNGFGSTNTTSINELHVFKNQIYAGTQSNGGTGPFQIWKSSTGNAGSWTKITSYTPTVQPSDASLISLSHTDFGGGIMYCGDVNVLKGGVIYRTENGTTWTKICKRGMGSTNSSITPNMVVFKGTSVDTFLYAGIGNTASSTGSASVWRLKYNSTDSTAWVKVIDFKTGLGIGAADTSITLPTYFYIWNNKIYVGCLDPVAGAALYRSDDGITWTAITANGFGSPANRAVASIVDYKNFLYATTTNSGTGGQLWRSSNGINFTQITGNAFGKGNLVDELHNIRVANGWLWTSGLWLNGTVQQTIVWRSSDGTNWIQSNSDGFGNTDNNGGGPIFIQFNNNVYCGLKNTVTGAQIWRTNVGVPIAGFATSNTTICEGGTITFTDTSQVALSYEWQLNGSPFSTARDTSYTFASMGTYTVSLIAINGSESDTANTVVNVSNCTGIISQFQNIGITIFPNPTTGKILINGRDINFIEIYNILGERIYSISNFEQRNEIDLTNVPKGIYFIRIHDGIKSYDRKIAVQ